MMTGTLIYDDFLTRAGSSRYNGEAGVLHGERPGDSEQTFPCQYQKHPSEPLKVPMYESNENIHATQGGGLIVLALGVDWE